MSILGAGRTSASARRSHIVGDATLYLICVSHAQAGAPANCRRCTPRRGCRAGTSIAKHGGYCCLCRRPNVCWD